MGDDELLRLVSLDIHRATRGKLTPMFYEWRPYVSVAERRKKAAAHAKKLAKKGAPSARSTIEGRTIAKTFWGKAWCDNLESYSDYANRLPRGRTYVRNGSVVDLQIAAGRVTAIVSGSELYEIEVAIDRVDPKLWKALVRQCAGQIGSMIDLLQGKLSRDGDGDPGAAEDGALPGAERDPAVVQLPGLGQHVQARRRGALRRRRPPR